MQVKCLVSSILVGLNWNQIAHYPLDLTWRVKVLKNAEGRCLSFSWLALETITSSLRFLGKKK